MRRLTKNIITETEFQWANVGAVITDDGIVLIDCPVRPTDSRKWQKDLRSLSPLGIRYLISTDYHGDHSTGSAYIEGVTYIAPQLAYEEMARIKEKRALSKAKDTSRDTYVKTLQEQGFKEEAEEIAEAVVPLPKICFEDTLILHFPPLTFQIRRLGAHSPACSAVYIPEEKVIFTSDNVIDSPCPGLRDASVDVWLRALEWIDSLPVDYIVPGHGEIGGKEVLGRLKNFLSGIRETMEKQVKAGKTKAEAIADSSFERFFWAEESRGSYWVQNRRDTFQRGLARVYDDLKGEQGR